MYRGKNAFGTIKKMSDHPCCRRIRGKNVVGTVVKCIKEIGFWRDRRKNVVPSVLSYEPWSLEPCSTVYV